MAVNLASAWLLFDGGEHHHSTAMRTMRTSMMAMSTTTTMTTISHGHGHDTNLRAAYVHVLADALTSVLAIVALTCGFLFGWVWMDPLMALVGVAVILSWSFGLIRGRRRGAARHGAGPASGGRHPQAARGRRRPGQ